MSSGSTDERPSRPASMPVLERCSRSAPASGAAGIGGADGIDEDRPNTRSSSHGFASSSRPIFPPGPRSSSRRGATTGCSPSTGVGLALPSRPRRQVRGLLPGRQRGGDLAPGGAASTGRDPPRAPRNRVLVAGPLRGAPRAPRRRLRKIRSDEHAIVFDLAGERSTSPALYAAPRRAIDAGSRRE